MTEEIALMKYRKYREQGGKCAHCGGYLPSAIMCDLAHILPQRIYLIKKYGELIIHHHLNMKLTHHCDICNSGVQISPHKTVLVEKHVDKIRMAIENE